MFIDYLIDLDRFKSAPKLSESQTKKLSEELKSYILSADWITVGIMASHDYVAVEALRSISKKYSSIKFLDLDSLHAEGSVFLKGNQRTGDVYIRTETGLGEGILLTCQYNEGSEKSRTYGPLPLDFFI